MSDFSLDGFTDYCKLKWSKPRLAKNLNRYRKAAPTEEFWSWYNGESDDPEYRKKQNAFLKQNGLSIYKEYGQFGLFDWNFDEKGTQEDYDKQQKEREEEIRSKLYSELLNACTKESPRDYEIAKRELQRCDTLEKLEDYAKYEILYGEAICDKVRYTYSLI